MGRRRRSIGDDEAGISVVLVLIGTRVDVEIVVVGVLEICTGGGVVVLEKLLERGVDKLGRLVDKFILLVVDGDIEEE